VALLLPVTTDAQVTPRRLGERTGAIAEPFSRIVAVEELPDGRVAVTDSRERALYLASFERGTVKQLGRNGNGPNEYSLASQLFHDAGDTLLLPDFPARRMLAITPQGALAGTRPMEGGSSAPLQGEAARPADAMITSSPRYRDATGALYYDVRYFTPERTLDREGFVARIDPATKTSRRVAPLRPWYPERSSKWRAPFMYQDVWAVAPDGRVARVVPLDYHVEWYKDGALLARGQSVPYEPLPVTREDREVWYAARAGRGPAGASLSGPPTTGQRETPRSTPVPRGTSDADFPREKPPFVEEAVGLTALVAPDGTLWVGRCHAFGARTRLMDVFDASGQRVRQIELPADRVVVGFSRSAVFVVRTDDDGLQWLERYRLP
jgi:hypothetical protein